MVRIKKVRITQYLKPFALSIAAVIVLLFAQAQCELALPDYMADIVDVGIQSGGIRSAGSGSDPEKRSGKTGNVS